MLQEDTLFSTVADLAARIRDRKLSPTALTEAYLERLERLGPELNAVVTVTRERALSEARSAEQEIAAGHYRGPLHGIPYGAKDLLAARGAPTTWGAPPLRNQVLAFDATVIRQLREAGAILIGKLAMLELAGVGHYRYASASLTGPGLNPWNTETYTGGSSSGSAAATAAGLVAFSIGSETWGSILTPASFCGVSGLRPTYGRVSRYGAMTLAWTMDKLGPMCRSVEDCGIVLGAIAGSDPNDRATLDEDFVFERRSGGLRGMTIGVVQEDFEAHGEPEVQQGFNAALHVLQALGAALEPLRLPRFPYDEVTEIVVSAEAACFFEGLIQTGRIHELADASQQAGILAGLQVRAVDYLKAMRLRNVLKSEFSGLWNRFDALVGPTSLTCSPPVDRPVKDLYLTELICAGNLLGLPAVSVPCGFGRQELPIALSVVGPVGREAIVLHVGQCYQEATDWHLRYPPFSGIERESLEVKVGAQGRRRCDALRSFRAGKG